MFNAGALARLCALSVALGSLCAGAALAWHHPAWPTLALTLFALWVMAAAWWPGIWLAVVPVGLTFLNFSPWTGWTVFDEFDLLLLGTLAAQYGGLAANPTRQYPNLLRRTPRAERLIGALLGATAILGLYRGISDAGGLIGDGFSGYTDPLNSLRVFKSLGFALLLWPAVRHEMASAPARTCHRLAAGMTAGLAVVVLAVLWERAAFAGLFDFSRNYRTAGLFWEMHVGGAALDAYLALASPFAVWAWRVAHRPVHRAGAATLAALTGYAVLTTFSRGLYLAEASALVLLTAWLRRPRSRPHAPWRASAGGVMVLVLAIELVTVLGAGSFMTERLASTCHDLGKRLAHWQRGVDLLRTPGEWMVGKGLGRFPAHYAAQSPEGEFSGSVSLGQEISPTGQTHQYVTLHGPHTRAILGGQFGLTQRVNPGATSLHRVSLNIRTPQPVQLQVELCERHLLYDGDCQTAILDITPSGTAWQTRTIALEGKPLAGGAWYAPRLAVFSLSIVSAAGHADLDHVLLAGTDSHELLINGTFSNGMAHWLPAAQSYFLPWHTDNLFLELLIERGALGLLLFCYALGYALWHLARARGPAHPLAPYLAAALCSALCVGLANSLMDVPRVAFLLYFLWLFSLQIPAQAPVHSHAKNQACEMPSAQTALSFDMWGLNVIKIFNHYIHKRSFVQLSFDLGLVVVAVVLAFMSQVSDPASDAAVAVAVALSLGIGVLVINTGLGFYQRHAGWSQRQVHLRTGASLALTLLLAYGVFRTSALRPQDEKAFLMALVVGVALMLIHRIYAGRATPVTMARTRVLVYGSGPRARLVGDLLTASHPAIDLVGYYASPNDAPHEPLADGLLPTNQSLTETVLQEQVSEIVVAVSERRGGSMPLRELLDCKLHGVKVVDVATHFEKTRGQIRRDSVSAGWLIFGAGFEQGPIRTTVKRLFDLVCASLLILLSIPLMVVAAVLILLESSGPILYLQERVGLHGRRFNVVKFRSMRTDAEKDGKPRWASAADERVTRVGRIIRKLRIDELPQLFSVLTGDMSLVGPRPERPYFVDRLTQELPYYAVRHSVKPGVTGWAQVRYHYGASVEDSAEKLQYDLYYVKNHSLLLDLIVLISTVGVVLSGEGSH